MQNLSKLPKLRLSKATFNELMFEAQKQGITLTGVIVFKSSNWPDQDYSLESRSYQVSNQCNYYDPTKISRALWGHSLDGSDPECRLDYYSWETEYCYLISNEDPSV